VSRVLFVCLHNAGRSQISEALFRLAAGDRHQARSAGSTPAEHVHPEVVEAMHEWDLPDPKGRPLDEVRAIREDIRTRINGLLEEL
jgi:arsenate reductase